MLRLFQAFQKEDIDPLQIQLQDISSLGQGLIQTAAKGTDTRKLEDDLEEVNTKWNTLNKKVGFFFVLSAYMVGFPHSFLFYFDVFCSAKSLWQFKSVLTQATTITTMCTPDCRAFCPTARGPVALWEIPGCAGVPAQLVD